MNKILFAFIIYFSVYQKTEGKIKYLGGMLFHVGQLKIKHTDNTYKGFCHGFGGQLSFLISDHIRVGSEGYTSYFNYHENQGLFRLGWGGVLIGYQLGNEKISSVLSLTLGGGRVNDMQFIELNTKDDNIDRIIYRKYPVMIASPAFSTEYSFKSKYTMVIRFDYLFPLISSNRNSFNNGPRIYFGFLFGR